MSRIRSLAVAFAAVALVGCQHDKTTADYVAVGQYGIGVHTFTFVDDSRPTPPNGSYAGAPNRTLPVDVWYPLTLLPGPSTDAPLRPGRYPLILHSHGYMDNRKNEGYLGEQLASHGYIVAAPDYPLSKGGAPGNPTVDDTAQQPLDARFVIDQLIAQSNDPSSMFAGTIDVDRIGASGLSLGGLTTLLLAFHPTLRDPRVKAAMAWAPPSCMLLDPFFANVDVPLLMIQGDADLVVPIDDNTRRSFPMTRKPSELIVLRNGSHTGFAGPAVYLDATVSYDNFACEAIGPVDVQSFASLGTLAQGISQDPGVCPPPCQTNMAPPSLDAERQHDLTKAIALGFFDGELRHDGDGSSFVQHRVASENPEVSAQLK